MADLPDIDTNEVGFIAYFNAIEQGGASHVDPDDALSSGRIEEYTLYDNGWHGKYRSRSDYYDDRLMDVRVKTDGWIVAYIDRTNDFDLNLDGSEVNQIRGYWDMMVDWSNDDRNTPGPFERHDLERAISDLQGRLDADHSYHFSDVGLYNFEYESATNATGLGDNSTSNPGFLYTDGTDVQFAAIAASSRDHSNSSSISFDGVTICGSGGRVGVLNVLSPDRIPDAETEYNLNMGSYTGDKASVLMIWS